jgi:hypothetical protein
VIVVASDLAKRLVPDELWELAAPLIPRFTARSQGDGTAPVEDRAVFTAIVYVLTLIRTMLHRIQHIGYLLRFSPPVLAAVLQVPSQLFLAMLTDHGAFAPPIASNDRRRAPLRRTRPDNALSGRDRHRNCPGYSAARLDPVELVG